MKNLMNELPNTLLLGAGPSNIAPATYHALAAPILGHMHPYFIKVMDGVKEFLQQLMNTDNQLTVPLSTSGSGGMAAAFANSVEPGDPVLILQNGVFSERMSEMARRLEADLTVLEFPWGEPVRTEVVEAELKKRHYKVVGMIYGETSTGVLNPVPEIGGLLKDTDTIFLVDAVPTMGGCPLMVDQWGIDICYSGSQKCLSCPPGLAPITFSPKAMDMMSKRKKPVGDWYMDVSQLMGYWGGTKRVYHHTAPINMIYSLYQGLYNIFEEGPEKVFARHYAVHDQLVAAVEELGWGMLVEPSAQMPMVNAITLPEGIDPTMLHDRLLNEYNIEIGVGLGALEGKIIRVGFMGYNAQPYNVDTLMNAVKDILK